MPSEVFGHTDRQNESHLWRSCSSFRLSQDRKLAQRSSSSPGLVAFRRSAEAFCKMYECMPWKHHEYRAALRTCGVAGVQPALKILVHTGIYSACGLPEQNSQASIMSISCVCFHVTSAHGPLPARQTSLGRFGRKAIGPLHGFTRHCRHSLQASAM